MLMMLRNLCPHTGQTLSTDFVARGLHERLAFVCKNKAEEKIPREYMTRSKLSLTLNFHGISGPINDIWRHPEKHISQHIPPKDSYVC